MQRDAPLTPRSSQQEIVLGRGERTCRSSSRSLSWADMLVPGPPDLLGASFAQAVGDKRLKVVWVDERGVIGGLKIVG
jgi:hypothetical protein